MTTIPRTRISKQLTQVPLSVLADQLAGGELVIPPHQRDAKSWDHKRAAKFIVSVLKGYPIPSILMSSKREGAVTILTLEDGLQRITAARLFRAGELQCDGRTYDELSEIEQERFDSEGIPVVIFSNATQSDRIQIFDWHQNGLPLTAGERYHAQAATPLVTFVKAELMTPGAGYHDRAAMIWGIRGDTPGAESRDKKRRWLLNAVALVKGIRFGPEYANKKYEPDASHMTADFGHAVKRDLERILEIYEAVEAVVPMTGKKLHNAHWDLGTFTGYILYSLSAARRNAYDHTQIALPPEERISFEARPAEHGGYAPNSMGHAPLEEWQRVKDGWVAYMVKLRRKLQQNPTHKLQKLLLDEHHKGISKARNWTLERWQDGYLRVFNPELVSDVGSSVEDDYSDSD
jgi:hypothetical protein